jgi:TonB family protein
VGVLSDQVAFVQTVDSILDVARIGPSPRLLRGKRASVMAFAVAVSVHAGLIAAAFWYRQSLSGFSAARLVLPEGVAAEIDGSDGGVSVQLLRDSAPIDSTPAAEPQANLKQLLAPPPVVFEPPQVARATSVVETERGTSDFGPLPELSAAVLPPTTGKRAAPSSDAGPGKANEGSAPVAEAPPVDDTNARGASAQGGSERGNGGARQGVVDGMPVPSAHNRNPAYPDDARRRGWKGTVQLELDLDETGRVTAARLLRSCGHEILDQAALEAARTWRYSPATMGGRPIPVTVPVPVNYALGFGH